MVLSRSQWKQIVQAPAVRAALLAKAQKVAALARQIDAAENESRATIAVETGTRPRGRSYARVTSDDVHGEYGDEKTGRRRTLGRAARGG